MVAAIPVAGMLALGTLIDQPVAGVTMAVGAMLVGIAWRAGGGPLNPPIGTMTGAGGALVIATFAGTVSGRWHWLHLGLLVVFCLAAGSISALGRRGSVVGTQSVIAFVVFGRFPEPLGGALTLAGLVMAGAVTQLALAWVVGRPPAWRAQREAMATAYQSLAGLAAAFEGPGSPAAEALDAAERSLAAPALFSDPAAMTLSSLLSEGRRIRLELLVLRSEVEQIRRTGIEDPPHDVVAGLGYVAAVLRLVGEAVAGGADGASRLRQASNELDAWRTAWRARTGESEPAAEPDATERIRLRLGALVGQALAAARLAEQVAGQTGRPGPHPTRGSRRLRVQLAEDLRQVLAGARLDSPAGRHAVRLAVVVAGTELLVQRVALPRAYWAVVAAATVLRPDFGGTFTRGAERVLGTCAGVVVATLIAVALEPSGWGIVVVVGLLAWATYSVFPASFTAGIAALTAVIAFLLHAVAPDSATIALDRGIDTAIGGSIGLVAYALWPTWSGVSVERRLAEVLDAQRAYLAAVFAGLVQGVAPPEAALRSLARSARTAWGDADAAITLSRDEPARQGIDPDLATSILVALRRQGWAIHAVRLDAAALTEREPLPALGPLASACDRAVALIGSRLRGAPGGEALPPLRELYRRAAPQLPDAVHRALYGALDELVDATNSVAAVLGIGLP